MNDFLASMMLETVMLLNRKLKYIKKFDLNVSKVKNNSNKIKYDFIHIL